ncbi:F-box only protein 43 [Syngnathoides biaculeatus]|uniref:F-box only protein 43 n=1 Tax=Syngnathoides biaculeatus TaxID=300417 RepID=UPI002ADE0B92|nr:F-box only protein 43 [Syngnathoides biaculeatus]XP_061674844.1 F-box only protein 43 [Syngnathoides biaculeatus]
MQCTPDSNVYHDGCKGRQCDECFDSGYSGLFHSPLSICEVDSSTSVDSVDFIDTAKGYLRVPATPKENSRARFLHKDTRGVPRCSTVNLCETPKVCKRCVLLQHRPALCDATKGNGMSPCTARTQLSIVSEHLPNASFESLVVSTLKPEQDFPLSGRKRRLLFSQVRTSTRVDGTIGLSDNNSSERRIFLLDDFSQHFGASDQLNVEAPCLSQFLPASSKENSPSPVRKLTNDLYDSSIVLSTPSSTQTPKYIRSLCEDSGFSSLALDKSHGSSVDHDGSFQELRLSASKGNVETPNLTDTKRRSRLQRQQRLSTLKEGGSLSDEEVSDRKHQLIHCHSSASKEEVFLRETPRRVLATSDGPSSTKVGCTTPLSRTTAQRDCIPPSGTTSVSSNVTPFKTTVSNLSLTPALQLIHILCERRPKMFAGQSPSLKEQLRTAAALTDTAVILSTIMPLTGLIGRKMGLGKVDILTELRKRNLRHILAVILSHLSADSLYRCCQVCKDWKEIIQQDKQAHLKKEIHRSEVEAALELGGTVHVCEAKTRLALIERSALKTVQAQSQSSSYCTPQSGTRAVTPLQNSTLSLGSSKRDRFLEVAKTLFNDECLRHCPHCQHPAKCHSVKREGVCTKADCAFQFCTACLCAFHGSRECGSQSAGHRKKYSLLPGSAQSKRNVRRL